MFPYYILISFLLFEFLVFIFIKVYKKKFQWLLTNEDELPNFEEIKFQKFKKESLDEKLGWKQKLESSGLQKNKKKYSKFRNNFRTLINKKKKKLVSSFGDSYVYCNYSEDKFTWQEQISKKSNFNILNYGVANYGLDQALLKYQNTKDDKSTKIVIMGFVPETIVRIQTRWKHYVEFGNIHGFKPCFELKNKKLVFKKNPISKATDIKDLKKIIQKLKMEEIFYKKKFLKYKFTFPFSFSFFKNFNENIKIFYFLLLKDLNFILKKKMISSQANNKLFNILLTRNVVESHKLYDEDYASKLLFELIMKFKRVALKRKQIPIIIIFPQPMDLKLKSYKSVKKFVNLLKSKIETIDISDFIDKKKLDKYYMSDKYGGHFSKYGNKIVSEIIKNNLKSLNSKIVI